MYELGYRFWNQSKCNCRLVPLARKPSMIQRARYLRFIDTLSSCIRNLILINPSDLHQVESVMIFRVILYLSRSFLAILASLHKNLSKINKICFLLNTWHSHSEEVHRQINRSSYFQSVSSSNLNLQNVYHYIKLLIRVKPFHHRPYLQARTKSQIGQLIVTYLMPKVSSVSLRAVIAYLSTLPYDLYLFGGRVEANRWE